MSKEMDCINLWGNGWAKPNPWRCKRYGHFLNTPTYLVGRPGVRGCFSFCIIGDTVDVALYDDTPNEISKGRFDAVYVQLPNISGFFWSAIRELNMTYPELKVTAY